MDPLDPDEPCRKLVHHVSHPFILLVEDNHTDEMLTCRALRKSLLNEIVVTRDGAEALDFLFARGQYADRSQEELPNVVLLDLNLPKIGGLDVLAQIRADPRTHTLPVVILTSSSEEVDLIRGYDNGANSYVVKPVAFQDFSDAVRQLGLYWVLVNRGPNPGSAAPIPSPASHEA